MPGPRDARGEGAFRREPVAVIDIGSNSLRLVVYDAIDRSPLVLFNEKVLCGLGRGLEASGRLNPEGCELALANVERFVALARSIGVRRLDLIATAAVRDASDGADFVARIEQRCGVNVAVIPGSAEGRLSALGVVSGIPDADGIMGDMGGGSVELVPLERGVPGAAATLPVGPLRLETLSGNEKRLREVVDQHIASLPWLRQARGRNFYLVGGALRALARIHMEHTRYPLHIIQHYAIAGSEAVAYLDVVGRLSRKSLEKIVSVSKKRAEVVPLAAFVLGRLIRAIEPRRIVFSAYGLREGHIYDLLTEEARRTDPLIVACRRTAAATRRFGVGDEEDLFAWASPLFAVAPRQRVLRAVALLSDIAWAEHPDYRADQAFMRALQIPVGGLDHVERVFLATALHARYGGAAEAPVKASTAPLLGEEDAATARAFGLALRLAYTLTGGAPHLLERTRLVGEDRTITLGVPDEPAFRGEAVQRRLDALGKALGRKTAIRTLSAAPRPEEPPRTAARA